MPNPTNHPPILFMTRPEVFDNTSGIIDDLPRTAKLDETFILYSQNEENMEGASGGGTPPPVSTGESGHNKIEFNVSQWVMVSPTNYRLSINDAPFDVDVYMTDATGVSTLVGIGVTYQGTTLLLECMSPFKGYIAY